MNKETIEFFKDYLLRTREEIDLEKVEGTRILYIKVIIISAILALSKGSIGLIGMLIIPFGLFALDHMQLSRLEYILHRWEYLVNYSIPKLKSILDLHNNFIFFEEEVIKRNIEGNYYKLESLVRTFIIIPTLIISSLSFGIFQLRFCHTNRVYSYLGASLWMLFLTALSFIKAHSENKYKDSKLYRRKYIVILTIIFIIVSICAINNNTLDFLNMFDNLLFNSNKLFSD